jgi:enoyl-CoA hydratase/carnithine racemase
MSDTLKGSPPASTAESMEDGVSYTVDDGIALITLRRPPVNALSSAMYRGLGIAAKQISEDEEIRVAILTGADRFFCGGADVKELAAHTPEEKVTFSALSANTRRQFSSIPVPVISAINGPAAGAGVAYSTYCDYRVAAADSFLSMPEINVGSVAGGGEALLSVGVPHGPVRFMLYTGRRLSAEEALGLHLIDEVAPQGQALDVAWERARAIAEKPRNALIAMKSAINTASRLMNNGDALFEFATGVRQKGQAG